MILVFSLASLTARWLRKGRGDCHASFHDVHFCGGISRRSDGRDRVATRTRAGFRKLAARRRGQHAPSGRSHEEIGPFKGAESD